MTVTTPERLSNWTSYLMSIGWYMKGGNSNWSAYSLNRCRNTASLQRVERLWHPQHSVFQSRLEETRFDAGATVRRIVHVEEHPPESLVIG